jgi:TFIIH basal transcription factor complex TTD-A subunit
MNVFLFIYDEIRSTIVSLVIYFLDMVNVVKGSLIKCDPAIKQYLVHLDETLAFGKKFILHNLDEQHLFVHTEVVSMIKEKLQEQIDKISYDSAQTK